MNFESGGQSEGLLDRALNFWHQSQHWQVRSRANIGEGVFEGHVRGDLQMMSIGSGQAYVAERTAYLRGPMFQSAVLGPHVDIRRLASVTAHLWMTCDRALFESRGHDHHAFGMFAKQFRFRPRVDIALLSQRSQGARRNVTLSVDGSPVVISVPAVGDPTIVAFGYFSGEINADLSYGEAAEAAFPHIQESETISLNDVIGKLKKPIKKVLEARAPKEPQVEIGQAGDGQFFVQSDLSWSRAPIESVYDAELEVIEFLTTNTPELLRHIDFDSHDLTLSIYADSQETAGQLADRIRTIFWPTEP